MYRLSLIKLPDLSYAANEAVNTLCTNITFAGEGVKKIMLTSCNSGDGKSFLSLNIARTMAGMGHKVALVDCDLRKSTMARNFLKLEDGPGMGTTHYLAGLAPLDDILYVTDVRNLFIAPCSKTVSNSLPLVSSTRLQEMLNALSDSMDYVIVDSPPVGLLIDAARIAACCDGTLLVVKHNQTRKFELVDAVDQLNQSGCPILGTVINQADFTGYVGSKYYSSKYYNSHYYNSYYYNNSSSEGDS